MAETPIDVRDMAIVHRTFRDAFSESGQLVLANPTPSPERVAFLADHIDFLLGVLHHHHASEDESLYPLLAQRVPEQLEMVNAVEAQHKTVTGAIESVTQSCTAWSQGPSVATAEALAARLDDLNAVLQPHLDDEEAKIVPLAAEHLTQKEWDSMGEKAVAAIPRKKLPIAFGLLTEPLNESDREHMKSTLPAPVRILFPVLIGRPWKKYAHTLRNGT